MKALEILRNENVFDEEYLCFNNIDISSAIEELEEAMKPKTCEWCNNLEDIGKSYKYCKELCINISHSTEMTFYCIRYKPKDNA